MLSPSLLRRSEAISIGPLRRKLTAVLQTVLLELSMLTDDGPGLQPSLDFGYEEDIDDTGCIRGDTGTQSRHNVIPTLIGRRGGSVSSCPTTPNGQNDATQTNHCISSSYSPPSTDSNCEAPTRGVHTSKKRRSSSDLEVPSSMILVFDSTMEIADVKKRRRNCTPKEQERINHLRKVGACNFCRVKKRKCTHINIEKMKAVGRREKQLLPSHHSGPRTGSNTRLAAQREATVSPHSSNPRLNSSQTKVLFESTLNDNVRDAADDDAEQVVLAPESVSRTIHEDLGEVSNHFQVSGLDKGIICFLEPFTERYSRSSSALIGTEPISVVAPLPYSSSGVQKDTVIQGSSQDQPTGTYSPVNHDREMNLSSEPSLGVSRNSRVMQLDCGHMGSCAHLHSWDHGSQQRNFTISPLQTDNGSISPVPCVQCSRAALVSSSLDYNSSQLRMREDSSYSELLGPNHFSEENQQGESGTANSSLADFWNHSFYRMAIHARLPSEKSPFEDGKGVLSSSNFGNGSEDSRNDWREGAPYDQAHAYGTSTIPDPYMGFNGNPTPVQAGWPPPVDSETTSRAV
ncbi:hypothetical protein M501DRAFT_1015106 [Patellaria atrata CBS 101060]|uniref:Uncharacterized protein n=1 Tax=Patellaria atrata CBS 101060 TaxID=1346257 RepID=A0A9P4SCA3_9PEZI|nr:hypothetical protein M501DRAFT_1015106 [Patellaria atrata CBS 101060]